MQEIPTVQQPIPPQQPPMYPPPTYQPPQQPPRPRKRIGLLLAVFVLLVTIAATVVGVLVYNVNHATCTIGVSGTAATVTLTGVDAPDLCSRLIKTNTSYKYEGEPSGAQMCSGDYSLPNGNVVHYIVRDSGAFLLAGNQLCKFFMGQ
jgi:hypothetical protein